jgi:excisionase family DNA binding protein
MSAERILMKPAEAAAALGIGRNRIYELIAQGRIPVVRVGQRDMIAADALREWAKAQSSAVTTRGKGARR